MENVWEREYCFALQDNFGIVNNRKETIATRDWISIIRKRPSWTSLNFNK
jgi:hypothetical protein